MLTILGVLVVMIALAVAFKVRIPGGVNADLGSVSQQWIAEYRASHPA